MKRDFVIGVLGGMGTYATIHQFQQYAEVFPAEKEWDRPRLIIDNRCTMPSRVRAFLYNENREQLVNEMVDSMQGLVGIGCTKIILACNTSHIFLPEIYNKVPQLEERVVNIVNTCVNKVAEEGLKEVYLLASEGTISAGIFQSQFEKVGVMCNVPEKKDYHALRLCIEAVKQNKYSQQVKETFIELVNRFNGCILGCTELPILYEKYKDDIKIDYIFDPLYLGLMKLKEEYENAEDINIWSF